MRRAAGWMFILGGCAVAVGGFYVSVLFAFLGVACGLGLWWLAELVLPDGPGPTVFDTSHLPLEREPVAIYDVRTRVTPDRLWSDG